MQSNLRRRSFTLLVLLVVLVACLSQISPRHFSALKDSAASQRAKLVNTPNKDSKESKEFANIVSNKDSKVRLTKVSVVYGAPNPLYEGALQSHLRHAERWGYGMQVLRREIVGGVWDKISYLLSLVLQEMAKPPEERDEWLWWVDADSIILNPAMPVDAFLPPADMKHIHMISSRDQNGLNAGILLFRVDLWTVNFLTETLGYPLFQPDKELGPGQEQEAMNRILKRPAASEKKRPYNEGNVFMPRKWINTYEFHFAYEGKQGDMLVHFPGLEDDKSPHMADWLKRLENTPNEWEVPLEKTEYPKMVAAFWKQYRAAWDAAKAAEEEIKKAPEGTPTAARVAALELLKTALTEFADDSDTLKQRLDNLQDAIKKDMGKT